MSEKIVSVHFTKEMSDEYMWGGYLKFLVEQGAVSDETPESEVLAIKESFLKEMSK